MMSCSKWQVVLYNKINMKEFCCCCIFNQCLIFQNLNQQQSQPMQTYQLSFLNSLPHLLFSCALLCHSASQHQLYLHDHKERFSCMGRNRMRVYFGLLVQLETQMTTTFNTSIYMTSFSTSLTLKAQEARDILPQFIRQKKSTKQHLPLPFKF